MLDRGRLIVLTCVVVLTIGQYLSKLFSNNDRLLVINGG